MPNARRTVFLVFTAVLGAGLVLAVPVAAGAKQIAPAARSVHPRPAQHHKPAPPKAAPAPPKTAPNVLHGDKLPAKPHAAPRAAAAAAGDWTVSLTTDATILWPRRFANLTATANMDVGPTPYYIRIFDATDGDFVASCGTGTTCAVPFTITYPGTHTFVGEITDSTGTVIPAVSPSVIVDWAHFIYKLHLDLAAKPGTVPVGASTTLTATTAEDIAPSPFETQIYDATTHTLLAQCYTGITCSATVSQSSATTHMYAAYVAYSVLVNGFEEEPDGSVQTAGFVYATWADTGWTVSLSAGPFSGGDQTFIATASADVAPTPYYIEIFSVYQNKQIGLCSSGSTCTAIHTSQFRDDDVQAFVTTITSSVFPLPDSVSVQASSNVVNPLTD